jgi:hypothetical protein
MASIPHNWLNWKINQRRLDSFGESKTLSNLALEIH